MKRLLVVHLHLAPAQVYSAGVLRSRSCMLRAERACRLTMALWPGRLKKKNFPARRHALAVAPIGPCGRMHSRWRRWQQARLFWARRLRHGSPAGLQVSSSRGGKALSVEPQVAFLWTHV